MNIKDSVALVTGGNRGLGKSLVQALLAAGARKVYVGSRKLTESSDTRIHPLKLDVTSEQDVAAAVAACPDVNILINNAGVASSVSFLAPTSLQGARVEMETNYFGMLRIVQAFAPVLKRNGGGMIVNILSNVSWFTSPALATYSATKAAAFSLTEGIRIELKSQGTRVAGVYAGFIDTDLTAQIDAPKVSPDVVAANTIKGILEDQEDIFADPGSRGVKAALDNDRQAFYRAIQQRWDAAH
ncbi:short-chain dehydrogenase [Reticulibacter mediterranei]|uniref:Short-chain dehydrogenase n=1 Tax=Reticulibacter mediterranei TaxID=2778369 RepID=A0A8J3IWC0_9CHLR|nr:SDR family oxidoreductase [Reticulibacter mediterranei]GHO99064.1 short-chain dehydrogenase [Reticulibacter mediterranei]